MPGLGCFSSPSHETNIQTCLFMSSPGFMFSYLRKPLTPMWRASSSDRKSLEAVRRGQAGGCIEDCVAALQRRPRGACGPSEGGAFGKFIFLDFMVDIIARPIVL